MLYKNCEKIPTIINIKGVNSPIHPTSYVIMTIAIITIMGEENNKPIHCETKNTVNVSIVIKFIIFPGFIYLLDEMDKVKSFFIIAILIRLRILTPKKFII